MLSAWQAALFNRWLAERMDAGLFDTLVEGDLAHKTDTGGLFDVEELERELPRFRAGAITFTGPLFGTRMRRPGGVADAGRRVRRGPGGSDLRLAGSWADAAGSTRTWTRRVAASAPSRKKLGSNLSSDF